MISKSSKLCNFFLLIDLTTEPIDLLLRAGAELNAKNAWGDTAVHYAPISGTYASLEYLVEIGIKIGKDEKCLEKVEAISKSYNFSKVMKRPKEKKNS